MTWSPAPMANRISVLEGASETTRWAGPVRVISRPSPSVKTGADVGVACGAHADAVIKVMSKVINKNFLNMFSPFYCKESKSPAEAGEVGEAIRVAVLHLLSAREW